MSPTAWSSGTRRRYSSLELITRLLYLETSRCKYTKLDYTHLLCVRPDVDVDGEVGDLHQEVFVLNAVHIMVAIKSDLRSKMVLK